MNGPSLILAERQIIGLSAASDAEALNQAAAPYALRTKLRQLHDFIMMAVERRHGQAA